MHPNLNKLTMLRRFVLDLFRVKGKMPRHTAIYGHRNPTKADL